MQTDLGASAAVETRTCVAVTALLVLMSRTVVDTITAQEDRQTITVTWIRTNGNRYLSQQRQQEEKEEIPITACHASRCLKIPADSNHSIATESTNEHLQQ